MRNVDASVVNSINCRQVTLNYQKLKRPSVFTEGRFSIILKNY